LQIFSFIARKELFSSSMSDATDKCLTQEQMEFLDLGYVINN